MKIIFSHDSREKKTVSYRWADRSLNAERNVFIVRRTYISSVDDVASIELIFRTENNCFAFRSIFVSILI